MTITIRRTTVGALYGWQEEGPCDGCGVPMFEGDPAYEVAEPGDGARLADDVFALTCSRLCAQSIRKAVQS